MKKIVLVFSCVIIVTACVLAGIYMNFKNSYKYSRYQIMLAMKNQNSEQALQYIDTEKIVDTMINEQMKELEGNPFAEFGKTIILSMRPTMIDTVKNSIENSINNGNEEVQKTPKLKLMYYAYADKSNFEGEKLQVEKIDKNHVTVTTIAEEEKLMTKHTFEKENGKWMITYMEVNQISEKSGK